MMKKALILTTAVLAFGAFATQAGATGKMVEIGTAAYLSGVPWGGISYNSMRFQCLWFKSDIGAAGYIQAIEWDRNRYTTSGTYNDTRVWLCHTTKTRLESTFNNNYTGKTPVQVMNKSTFRMPAGPGWVNFGIDPDKFKYNNSDNLLMEVRWNGDSGVQCTVTTRTGSGQSVWTTNHMATTGTVRNYGQCIRLYIGTMTGVGPSSLGRVKTLFR
jgi:hypothetical protein